MVECVCVCVCVRVHTQLWTESIPWTAARQAPLSMGFSRLEGWSGLPFPSPGDIPDPGIKPVSPTLAGGFFTAEPPGKPNDVFNTFNYPIIQSIRNKIYNVYLNI